jgi:hypothetical protein
MAEPTFEEQLRRLHGLYLAEAGANAAYAVGSTTGHADAMNALRNRANQSARTVESYLEADALAAGLAPGAGVAGFHEALGKLRTAAFRTVALRAHVAALKAAIDAPVSLPKSAYVEQRKWMRQYLDAAEGDAARAIRTALALVAPTDKEVRP